MVIGIDLDQPASTGSFDIFCKTLKTNIMNSNNFSGAAADWSHLWRPAAVLRATGEDARTFLQGQFSQNLRADCVTNNFNKMAYGLWLSPKGRVLADSFALVTGPAEVWLVSQFSAPEEIRAHLE
jgi:folate-binding Fe-S cluster repair protein YgfZ